MNSIKLNKLPPTQELETQVVLRALVEAHRHLAELKGVAVTSPLSPNNQLILYQINIIKSSPVITVIRYKA